MYVDYTNLNKSCPKDSFSLPQIDQVVDATSGYELLTFMDVFVSYNQIRMTPHDWEHTFFITDREIYYCRVIPFELKNVRVIY